MVRVKGDIAETAVLTDPFIATAKKDSAKDDIHAICNPKALTKFRRIQIQNKLPVADTTMAWAYRTLKSFADNDSSSTLTEDPVAIKCQTADIVGFGTAGNKICVSLPPPKLRHHFPNLDRIVPATPLTS